VQARAGSQAREIHPQKSPTPCTPSFVSLLEDTSQFQSPLRLGIEGGERP
jgi:hypothetical protein